MAYCLENAVAAIRDTNPWLLQSVDFEALEGITDGSNRVFRTPHRPLDEASEIAVYQQDGTSLDSGNYTMVSWNNGVMRFASGVSEQYYADYYVADQFYSVTKLKEICRAGFREMMRRWTQAWYLVDSGGSTYISNVTTGVTDPIIGALTFSTSDPTLHTFHLCCEYELAGSRLRQAAAHNVDYREGMSGGVSVVTHHQVQALADLRENLSEDIDEALEVLEETLSGTGYGGFISGAKSDAYEDVYEWWDDTDQAG